MPFWKQSEDPWDRKPDKRWPAPREDKEPQANPLDSLKQWNEDRKTRAKEKEEAKRLPPEKCPWCGKDMEQGYMMGGRDAVCWYPGVYKFDLVRGLGGDSIDLLNDGSGWTRYKTVWLCRGCKKMTFDMPDPPEDPFASWPESGESKEEETKEEETSEE